VLDGCTVHRFLLKTARAKEIVGQEIRGTVPVAVAVCEKMMEDRGYRVQTTHFQRGPGFNAARKVEGYKESNESLKSVAGQAAGALALGVIGIRKEVKTGRGDVLTFEVCNEWDQELWDVAVPGVVLVNTWGGSCDKNLSGQITNCQATSGFDTLALTREVEAKIAEYQAAHPAVTPAAATPRATTVETPAAAAGDAEYQASSAAYTARNYDEAWRQAYAAVQANPQHWQAWQMIGNCQYAKGDKPGAISSYRNSLAINPGNSALQTFVDQLQAP